MVNENFHLVERYNVIKKKYALNGKVNETLKEIEVLLNEAKSKQANALICFLLAREAELEGRVDDELKYYDDLLEISKGKPELLFNEPFQFVLVNKGAALVDLGEPEEAIKAYDESLRLYNNSSVDSHVRAVILSLVNKGVAFKDMGKFDKAIESFEMVWTRYGNSEKFSHQDGIPQSLVYMGSSFFSLGHYDKANEIYDETIKKYKNSKDAIHQEVVLIALMEKGDLLCKSNRLYAAIRLYDEALARYNDSENLFLKMQNAHVLSRKGNALVKLYEYQEAIKVFEFIIERFNNSQHFKLQGLVAGAFVEKGAVLNELENYSEAIELFDMVIQKFKKLEVSSVQLAVARALAHKAISLERLGKPKQAIECYDDIIKRFYKAKSYRAQNLVGNVMANKGIILKKLHPTLNTIEFLNESISYIEKIPNQGSKSFLIQIMSLKALVLLKLSKNKEALTVAKRIKELSPESQIEVLSQNEELTIEIDKLLKNFDQKKRNEFRLKIQQQSQRSNSFLRSVSNFSDEKSFLLLLREWNSYTPIIPDAHEVDRGGGYFIFHYGYGVVIDPGYNFVENFWRAGGRIHDIDTIVITHAHDDHTADFEAILTLLHQYNKRLSNTDNKKVNLILSIGAQRKLSGFFDLRGKGNIGRVIVLNPCYDEHIQQINISEIINLTVLPAYHDDIITSNGSVGLLFQLKSKTETVYNRYIVFTGDTGLYPKLDAKNRDYRLTKSDGKINNNIAQESRALLDISDRSKAIDSRYLRIFSSLGIEKIDLIIPHLGSIKEYELDVPTFNQDKPLFYPNHLGLHGLSILLDNINFKIGIVSEFGEELKDIRVELVEVVGRALKNKDKILIPGDITIVYNIESGELLCHRSCDFENPEELLAIEDIIPEDSSPNKKAMRIYLCNREGGVSRLSESLRNYHERLAKHQLPYFK